MSRWSRPPPIGCGLEFHSPWDIVVFVGHIGAGFGLKKVAPRLNLGVLLLAALFADLLLWALIILGVESIIVPENFRTDHYFTFDYPYSHSLTATIAWSGLAGAAVWLVLGTGMQRRLVLALIAGAAVFSHFVLDLVVHVPDLPLLSNHSAKLGLGLWRNMPAALALELGIALAALIVYLRAMRQSRPRTAVAVALVAIACLGTAIGPYAATEPPPPMLQAASSFVTILIVVAVGFWIDGRVGLTAPGDGT